MSDFNRRAVVLVQVQDWVMIVSSYISPKARKGAASAIEGRGLALPVMLFINHSCEPNVGFAGNVVLVAMRDISPGKELTTD
jgi:SET domain-containing protein